MAIPTLSTEFSRRAMLAGSTASIALPTAAAFVPIAPDPDARLMRRVAVVARLRAGYAGARAERLRLSKIRFNHPEYPGLLVTRAAHDKYNEITEQVGYRAARDRCWDLFGRYAAATRAAVATPAHTPRGLHAKLSLCLEAAWKGEMRIYMFEDSEWLEYALADLARMGGAGECAGAGAGHRRSAGGV